MTLRRVDDLHAKAILHAVQWNAQTPSAAQQQTRQVRSEPGALIEALDDKTAQIVVEGVVNLGERFDR